MNPIENYNSGWWMLIYRVPSTPSTSRVIIWKRVKEMGALHLQQSVYLLPNLPHVSEFLRQLKEQIQHFGGECRLLEVSSLGAEQEKEAFLGFENLRKQEYAEVIEGCEELLGEIDRESRADKFSFPHWEENEKHIQKLRELLAGVTKRDYFGSSLQEVATQKMLQCETRFDAFSKEVFSREGIVTEEKRAEALSPETGAGNKEALPKGGQVFSRAELIPELKGLIGKLESHHLSVSGKKVSPLSPWVNLELDYKEHKNGKALDIKIEWPANPGENTPDRDSKIT
jgi:hypothetical protein